MVKRIAAILTALLLIAIPVYSDFTFKGGAEVGGFYVHLSEEVPTIGQNVRAYSADPYLHAIYKGSDLRGEVKAGFSYLNVVDTPIYVSDFSLDRAFIRFRLPSFNDSKMTIIAGKSPVSWGMGQLYRAGDVMFTSPISNDQAGEEKESCIWIASVSQPVAGFNVNLAASLPIENSTNEERIGAMVSRSFDNDRLKEVRAAYSYQFGDDDSHLASVLVDMNLYFDVNVAAECRFRDEEDWRFVVNLMRMFDIDTEYRSYSLTVYGSAQFDLHDKEHDISEVVSVDLTDRTTITVMNTNSFEGEEFEYTRGSVTLSTTTNLADGVDLNLMGMYCYSDELSLYNMGCDILAGASLEYRF